MKPSKTQLSLIAQLLDGNRIIERRPGGFWTAPGVAPDPLSRQGAPAWWYSTNTVQSLAYKGILIETKRQQTRHGSFVVEYTLAEGSRRYE